MESYYDFKPEKVKEGDLLINEDNVYLLKLPDIHAYQGFLIKNQLFS